MAQNYRTYKTRNGLAPAIGPVGLPVTLNFPDRTATFDLDFTKTIQDRDIDIIQSVWVDNADNPNKLIIQCDQTQQRLVIPAFAQQSLPIICPQDPRLNVSCDGNQVFAGKVQLIFQNIPVPIASWGPIDVTLNNVTVSQKPLGSNFTASTGNTGGASVVALAANVNATRRIIANPANNAETLYLQFGGVADASALPLLPGEKFDTENGPIDQSAWQVFSVNNIPFSAWESV
jgi:hypothetical protein